MKKLFLFVIFIVLSYFSNAQSIDSIAFIRKNIVKFLPINLPFQTISFEYERMITAKNSITFGVGFPNQQSIIGKYGIDNNSDIKVAEFGTMNIRTAFRHYTGNKNLPVGFYVEPYLKYQNISGNGVVLFGDKIQEISGDVDVKLNSLNFGIQLGTQFLIARRVTVDLYFLGLEGGLLNGDLTATSEYMEHIESVESDIKDIIADLPSFIGNKLEVTKSNSQVNVKANNTPYPWLRFGLNVGIAF